MSPSPNTAALTSPTHLHLDTFTLTEALLWLCPFVGGFSLGEYPTAAEAAAAFLATPTCICGSLTCTVPEGA